jgi:copper chaperone
MVGSQSLSEPVGDVMEQLHLRVGGISCTGCEQRIERALGDLDGVRRVNADHHAGAVTVLVDDSRADEDAVRSRIERAGYEVKEAA